MKTYARDIITNAGLLSGIIDVFGSADDNELRAYLRLLNNILEKNTNKEYFPYAKDIYTIDSTLEPSVITIGKEQVSPAGSSETWLTGTITGLKNDITTINTVPLFENAVVTTPAGKFYIPGTSTFTAGRVQDASGNYYEILNGVPGISGTISAGSELTLFTANVNTVEGVFTNVDVFANSPRFVKSVAYLRDDTYRSLNFLSADNYDEINRITTVTASEPSYAIVRHDFPITKIELYPLSSSGGYKITVEKELGPYDFSDEVELPLGYTPFLEARLAHDISLMNGAVEKLPYLDKMAKDALTDIKRINDQPSILNNKAYYNGNNYDVYTDQWR